MMGVFRRNVLKVAGTGVAGATTSTLLTPGAQVQTAWMPSTESSSIYHGVCSFGATGDGSTIVMHYVKDW
jgi:hypothetical protein